jgi:hypothetical protein
MNRRDQILRSHHRGRSSASRLLLFLGLRPLLCNLTPSVALIQVKLTSLYAFKRLRFFTYPRSTTSRNNVGVINGESTSATTSPCGKETVQCKGYTAYVTLYAISTNIVNVSQDFVSTILLDSDCCLALKKQRV